VPQRAVILLLIARGLRGGIRFKGFCRKATIALYWVDDLAQSNGLPDVKFGINPVAAFRAGYPGATAPAGAISFLKNNFSNNMAADSNSNLLL